MDIQRVIPIPEVEDYQVRIREKKKAQQTQGSSRDYTKYNVTVAGTTFDGLNKRQMMFRVVAEIIKCGKSPHEINEVIPVKKTNLFEGFDGTLDSDQYIERLAVRGKEAKRYFTEEEELFHVGGKTYALNNQWGSDSVEEALGSLQQILRDIGIVCEPVRQLTN